MDGKKNMSMEPGQHGWRVEVRKEEILEASQRIHDLYDGVERKNMEGWLERFLIEVYDHPLDVLGFPPRQVAGDPDMMYFPGDVKSRISGVAHVSKAKKLIHVFAILVKTSDSRGKK
jgi:hypothetical protein